MDLNVAAIKSREEKFRKQINDNQTRIHQLEKIKAEYEELDKTLETLPEKIKHTVMVPLGDKAFIPGFLVNTNEITVALGDNYFVKCSAKHARGIVERRKALMDGKVKVLKEEFEFLKGQVGLATELLGLEKEKQDVVEIREEYHSDDEFELRTAPEPVVKPNIQVLNSTESQDNESEDPNEDPNFQLFREFERLELEAEQMELDSQEAPHEEVHAEEREHSSLPQKRKSLFAMSNAKRQHTETLEPTTFNSQPTGQAPTFQQPVQSPFSHQPIPTQPQPRPNRTQDQLPKVSTTQTRAATIIEGKDVVQMALPGSPPVVQPQQPAKVSRFKAQRLQQT